MHVNYIFLSDRGSEKNKSVDANSIQRCNIEPVMSFCSGSIFLKGHERMLNYKHLGHMLQPAGGMNQ
jgi:hypothetical protein